MNPGSLILFAQQQQGPPPEGVLAFMMAWLAFFIGGAVCGLVIWLVVSGLFCRSMAHALNQVAEDNRQMQPGLAWLFMVPCLHLVWMFLIGIWVPASLEKEFKDRRMHDGSNYGKTLGLTSAILLAVGSVLSCIPYLNLCTWVIPVAGFVCAIIFWVQISGYSAKLAESGGKSARAGGDDDE